MGGWEVEKPEEKLSEGLRPLFLCGWQALLELDLHKGSVLRPPGVNRGNNVCGIEGGDQLLDGAQLFGKVKLRQVDGHPGGSEEFLGGD